MSQNCDNSLSGTVTDIHDGQLLIGVTLIIADTEQTVQTGLDGEFSFSNLCNDTYFIQVSHPYCLTKGFTVRISGNTKKSLPPLNALTVVVNDSSTPLFETSLNITKLSSFNSIM